jgi:broad specificity phosphatase PhoE
LKIMLIRHAEKPEGSSVLGVKEDGTHGQHSLVVQGWQRAGALVAYFSAPTLAEIAVPTYLYASSVDLRPIETITPLARRLGVTADQTFAVGDEAALVASITSRDGVVLVAWEHKHIPLIADHLTSHAPQTWPGDRFDVVWIFDRQSSGSYSFAQVPQMLLAGDSP